MEHFLRQVAKRVMEESMGDMTRTLVVFNNHRSEVFLRREYEAISMEQESMNRVFFMPKMMVIDEVIAKMSGLEIVQQEFLLFELFRIHSEIGGEGRKYKEFEEFINFGDMMLSDFAEVDRYMVDARQLFLNLHDLKAIGEWDISSPDLTEGQKEYLAFYRSLYDYYTTLRGRLKERGLAYGGMAYREVAENIERLLGKMEYEKIYFVGFNALSECERRIIGAYCKAGIGHLVVDGDRYYYDDQRQEAGYFLRKHSGQFPELRESIGDYLAQSEKEIHIVEASEEVMQCKYVGHLLESKGASWLKEAESTAIVLADETLLLPMLNSLPQAEGEEEYAVNVSMGYSFIHTNAYMLAMSILRAIGNHSEQGFYHRDIIECLSNNIMVQHHKVENIRGRMYAMFRKEERVRCEGERIKAWLEEVGAEHIKRVAGLFEDKGITIEEILERMIGLCGEIAECGSVERSKMDKQALATLTEVLTFLRELQERYRYIESIGSLTKIFMRMARRHKITLLGEPLSGLQIMGVLETRNLDFRRVVMVSTNEGVIPSGRSRETLIPHQLKVHFGMPTYEERDNIFAYHFYRLMQRAEEVYLIYHTNSEGTTKGQASRFIAQIENELARQNAEKIKIRREVIDISERMVARDDEGGVKKSERAIERMKEVFYKGFSPTAINTYENCPLQFYYHYVLGIRTEDSIEEEIDASHFGTAVHKALEEIYGQLVGQRLRVDYMEKVRENIKEYLDKGFFDILKGGRSKSGKNGFLYGVAESQVRHIVEEELRLLKAGREIVIEGLEVEMEGELCRLDDGTAIKIRGRADRIDRMDGRVRIIDYKTGRVSVKDLLVKENKEGEVVLTDKSRQLLIYAWLYHRSKASDERIVSGIFPLMHLREGLMPVVVGENTEIDRAATEEFSDYLKEVINEIFSMSNTIINSEGGRELVGSWFEVGGKERKCSYCAAKRYCQYSIFN